MELNLCIEIYQDTDVGDAFETHTSVMFDENFSEFDNEKYKIVKKIAREICKEFIKEEPILEKIFEEL